MKLLCARRWRKAALSLRCAPRRCRWKRVRRCFARCATERIDRVKCVPREKRGRVHLRLAIRCARATRSYVSVRRPLMTSALRTPAVAGRFYPEHPDRTTSRHSRLHFPTSIAASPPSDASLLTPATYIRGTLPELCIRARNSRALRHSLPQPHRQRRSAGHHGEHHVANSARRGCAEHGTRSSDCCGVFPRCKKTAPRTAASMPSKCSCRFCKCSSRNCTSFRSPSAPATSMCCADLAKRWPK